MTRDRTQPRTSSLEQVLEGVDSAGERVLAWPAWKRALSSVPEEEELTLPQPYAPLDINHAAKAQWVRVADVVVIGPLMCVGGAALWKKSTILGALLGFFGVGTIAFNGFNWIRVQKQLKLARRNQSPNEQSG